MTADNTSTPIRRVVLRGPLRAREWAVGEEEKAYEYDASKSGDENMKLMGDEVKADRAER